MGMKLTAESRDALPAAREWLTEFYGTRHALSPGEVVLDVHKRYPGGWDAFVAERGS